MRNAKAVLLSLLTLFTLSLGGSRIVKGQTSAPEQPASSTINDRDRGIQLYQKGDVKGAVAALRIAVKRDQNDLAAWHYLGLALEQKGNKGANKAHEKATKLGESLLDRQLNQTPNTKEIPRGLLVVRSEL